jgi:hypothetical protein
VIIESPTPKPAPTTEAGPVPTTAAGPTPTPTPATGPTIGQKPQSETADPNATFTFVPKPGNKTRCSIDGGELVDCSDGLNLKGLAAGEHTVVAYTTDADGVKSAPTTYTWTVKGKVVFTARIAKKGKVSKNTVTVMCKISGDTIKICNVKVYAKIGKKQVAIATGRRVIKVAAIKAGGKPVGKPTIGVKMKLNKRGKALLKAKPKVTAITIKAKAQPVGSAGIAYKTKAKIRPAKVKK